MANVSVLAERHTRKGVPHGLNPGVIHVILGIYEMKEAAIERTKYIYYWETAG